MLLGKYNIYVNISRLPRSDVENPSLILDSCHMFYKDRVLDVKDKLTKWAGMPGESERVEIDR